LKQAQTNSKIKVLIVDDSRVSLRLYKGILATSEIFEIVATASNGHEAIKYTKRYQPNVISMDINMPLMDGVEATKRIMDENPVPILIVSSLYENSNVELAMEVLEAGAVAIIPKPNGPGHARFTADSARYIRNLKRMSEVKVTRKRIKPSNQKNAQEASKTEPKIHDGLAHSNYEILVIGASAGGPEAVKAIVNKFEADFPLPIVLVQHIDPDFTVGYKNWLQTWTKLELQIIEEQTVMMPGHVYLSPGNKHIVLTKKGRVGLSDDLPFKGHRPSVAQLFESAAKVYGKNAIAVLLSGMGTDGAAALKTLKDLGALTLVQDEESCLVFGMPGTAVQLGAACSIAPPDEIVKIIMKCTNHK
jgi:two-component system chemotaxis response regulator CheB